MVTITFIEFNGTSHVVEVDEGKSLMQNAVERMLPGIVGDCGGCLTCATCHAYVDPVWVARLPPKAPDEATTLEGALEVRENSRLTCQITVTPELDGLVVRLPESQF